VESAAFFRLVTLAGSLVSCLCATETAKSAEFGDIELSGYALGSWPRDQDIYNQGTVVPASIQPGFGAGLKVGLFPSMLHRMVGVEMDSNMHSSALSFPNLANGRTSETGRSDLLMINTTFNLILRYPGERIRPYVGGGIGWSHGTLLNPNIAGRDDSDFDSTRAFVHQFFSGVQLILDPQFPLFNTEHSVGILLFGEYRYVSANYHWEALAMDFRTHYGLVGIGLRF